MRKAVFVLFLSLLLAGTGAALDVMTEEAHILGADELTEGLSEEADALLGEISPVEQADFAGGIWKILSGTLQNLGNWMRQGEKSCAMLLAVVLLCAMGGTLEVGKTQDAVRVAGCLAIAGICTSGLSGMTALAEQTLDELGDFTALLLPVLASAVTAAGGTVSGGALYAGASLLIGVLTNLIRGFLIPCVHAYLLLATAQYALGDGRLERLRELVGWVERTALKGTVAVFTGYLPLTGLLSGASDEWTLKAAQSALSAAVPVVGSMISDASQTILTSAGMVRNAAGTFGLLAVLATGLGPFLQLAVRYLLLRVTAAVSGLLAEEAHAKLLGCAARAMGDMLAMVGSGLCMLLVSICCFLKVVHG